MKVTVTAKKNFIYDGKIYKRGESFFVEKAETGKLAKFLIETIQPTIEEMPSDNFPPAEGLPPLDVPKKVKKNGGNV